MAKRTVVTKKSRADQVSAREFTFKREVVPAWRGANSLPESILEYKQKAWELSEQLPLPTIQDEAWRRTDIRGLQAGKFTLAEYGSADGLPSVPANLLDPLVGERHGGQVILLPGGKSQVQVDPGLTKQGVIFTDLATALQKHPQLVAKLMGQIVRPDEGKFAAQAAALANQGVFVYIPRNIRLEAPLHSLLWGPGAYQAYFSHVLIWVEDGAELTYVHESASPTEAEVQTMHAGLVEIHVGAGANLRFVELQSWGEHVWNFSHERARVSRNGNLDWIFGAIGSHLTKNFSDLDLIGEGSSGRMSGFYFTNGNQHLDHDTQQNHLAPHTTSDLLFKGALKDHSRSVWQGMIYVAPGAQKTDGYQANRNLILSPKARADSIPGLEILADDVRCTHGATVGKIDPELLFYLHSRGISPHDAERLVVEGFFDPIMQRIPFEDVRKRFQNAIQEKMG